MENLAKRVGMKQILGVYNGCLIGRIPGINGICICTPNRGIVASGFYTYIGAKNYVDMLWYKNNK